MAVEEPHPDTTDTAEFPPLDPPPPVSPPAPARVRVRIAARTHNGLVRTRNEDHFLAARLARSFDILASNLPPDELPRAQPDEAGYVMVVADGMGGMAAGDRASRLALRIGTRLVLDAPTWTLRINDAVAHKLMDRMREYFHRVDRAIANQGRDDLTLSGMATTLTVAYSVGADLFIVHAGDCRVYRLRAGTAQQLTTDHNLAQWLADEGRIPPEAVPTHSKRHVVTNYAGGHGGIDPEVNRHRLLDGDRLLLCSDGLSSMVDDPTIVATLAAHDDPDGACLALIDHALAGGGRDNVTVIVAHYRVEES